MIRRGFYALVLTLFGASLLVLLRLILKVVEWAIDGQWLIAIAATIVLFVVLYVVDAASQGDQ